MINFDEYIPSHLPKNFVFILVGKATRLCSCHYFAFGEKCVPNIFLSCCLIFFRKKLRVP